jgi:hypothetical protein
VRGRERFEPHAVPFERDGIDADHGRRAT